MLKRSRQAGQRLGRILYHPIRLIGTMFLALLIGLGVISWRLSRGPVALPFVATGIGSAASRFQPGLVVTIGHAKLAWEGFHTGGAPLDLRLSAISLRTPKGTVVGAVSRLRITLAPLALLRGRIAPVQVIARRTAITIRPQPHRSAIRTLRETAARLAAALNAAPAGAAPAGAAPAGQAPTSHAPPSQPRLDMDRLRLIRILHANIMFDEDGLHLAAPDSMVTLRRLPDGAIKARARAVFHGDPQPGGGTMLVRLAYDAAAGQGAVRAVIGPGSLPDLLPRVKALAAAHLPVTIDATLPFGQHRKPSAVALHVAFGKGSVAVAQGKVPVNHAEFNFAANTTTLRLTHGSIQLGGAVPATPVITLTGSADETAAVHAMLTAHIPHVTAAALPFYWPRGLARNTRKFVLGRIAGGAASDGVFHFGISFDQAANRIRLDRFDGSFQASDVIFKWIKTMPPMTGLTGWLHFPDKDQLRIHVNSGQVGGLALSKALVVINGIAHKDQAAVITGAVAGPVHDAIAMLAPRADQAPNDRAVSGLQSRLQAAQGQAQAQVRLTIPFKKHLNISDMELATSAHLTRLHLPLPLGDLALRNGDVRVKAGFRQNRITASMTGAGMIGDQPARFSGQLMPLQTQRFTLRVKTKLDRALLAEAGYAGLGFGRGVAPSTLVVKGIPGQADLTMQADLAQLAFALPSLGWSKPAGVPGLASLGVTLRGGKPIIRRIAATAPDLRIKARGEGGSIIASKFDIGRTHASGKITPPRHPGGPWMIALAGPVLDLSSAIAQARSPAGSGTATQAQRHPVPWHLRAAFDRLILRENKGGTIAALNLLAAGSGSHVAALRVTALLAKSHHVEISLLPAQPGRALHIVTSDGGALLQALGIADTITGGKLDLAAHDLNGALTGKATMTGFRLRHAPLIGKVLQGMTLYGLAEATSGPGLAFSRLVVPFTLAHQVLTIRQGRAFSASLGVTMAGQADFARKDYNLAGTIVPAYALNSLPGRIPVLGRLFRAVKGSGLFSARYTLDGPFAAPHIMINPLAALAPGVFGRIFGSGPPDKPELITPNVIVKKPP